MINQISVETEFEEDVCLTHTLLTEISKKKLRKSINHKYDKGFDIKSRNQEN